MINELRVTVAEFQQQTHSSDVLDFVVWVENRQELIKKYKPMTNKEIGEKVAKAIIESGKNKTESEKR